MGAGPFPRLLTGAPCTCSLAALPTSRVRGGPRSRGHVREGLSLGCGTSLAREMLRFSPRRSRAGLPGASWPLALGPLAQTPHPTC